MIDLITLKWKDVILRKIPGGACAHSFSPKTYEHVTKDGNLEAFYGHKMCLVTHERDRISIETLGEITVKNNKTIKCEGVYMFGGISGTQKD